MKVRHSCQLEELYSNSHPIKQDSPELLFMQAVCRKDWKTAQSFFREEKLFSGEKCAVDAPYGRYEGLDGIQEFVSTWLTVFHAESATINPLIQTIAGGRVALEAAIHFVVDGEINQVPMFIIGDFRGKDTLDEIRIYTHCSFVPDLEAYRKPMFRSAHLEAGDPDLLTGAPREYYLALHHCPAVAVERVMGCISKDCIFGGYEKWGEKGKHTYEEIREAYEYMKTYIPRCVGMRYETIIDDGRTCVIEWVHIVSQAGQEELERVALSGIAAYERNEEGLLCSIRISDYAGLEKTINWEKIGVKKEEAQKINFVEKFPPNVGVKSLL